MLAHRGDRDNEGQTLLKEFPWRALGHLDEDLAGPSVGGALVTTLGWRAVFFANVPLVVVAFGLAVRHLPRDRERAAGSRDRFDAVGTALLAAALPCAAATPVFVTPDTAYLSSADVPPGFYAGGAPSVLETLESGTLDGTLSASHGVLLDVGANAECKPEQLREFAIMGALYSRAILGVRTPKVGLMSIGEEEAKGNPLTKEAAKLLRDAPVNFVGNVEGRDIYTGEVDVIVCDGFTGNVILKTSEGLIAAIMGLLKTELGQTIVTQAGALLSRPAFLSLKKRFDYSEFGGAPLLGTKQIVVICHGRSNAKAIKNAIRVAKEFYEARLNERIETDINELARAQA